MTKNDGESVTTTARCLNCTEVERNLRVALDERDKAGDVRDELSVRVDVLQLLLSGDAIRRRNGPDDVIRALQAIDVRQRNNIWELERFQELLLESLRTHEIPIPAPKAPLVVAPEDVQK